MRNGVVAISSIVATASRRRVVREGAAQRASRHQRRQHAEQDQVFAQDCAIPRRHRDETRAPRAQQPDADPGAAVTIGIGSQPGAAPGGDHDGRQQREPHGEPARPSSAVTLRNVLCALRAIPCGASGTSWL